MKYTLPSFRPWLVWFGLVFITATETLIKMSMKNQPMGARKEAERENGSSVVDEGRRVFAADLPSPQNRRAVGEIGCNTSTCAPVPMVSLLCDVLFRFVLTKWDYAVDRCV